MSNLGSESEVLDLEKGISSDPGTATASASATASVERAAAAELEEEDDTELVTVDHGTAKCLGVVGFCVVAIVVFLCSVYAMYKVPGIRFWEAFGLCAAYFIICVASIGTVLRVAFTSTPSDDDDDTSSTMSDATTNSTPIKLLYLF